MVITKRHDDSGGHTGILISGTVSWRYIAFAVDSGDRKRRRRGGNED
jgi:hypothetical protein